MATQQEDLLKALRGSSGREQVTFDLGQVGLRPTIQQGGQYTVPVREAPKFNPALQLATALQGGSQLLSSFVDLQSKQGEIEGNALNPQQLIKAVENNDPKAVSFLDKLGKEKAFSETAYKRYYAGTVQPALTKMASEMARIPAHEWAAQGITTPEQYSEAFNARVTETLKPFQEYIQDKPYAQSMHNRLMEEMIPQMAQQSVNVFDENVGQFVVEESINNQVSLTEANGVDSSLGSKTVNKAGVITDFGQTGKNGGYKDPNLDSNSALGMGFKVSPEDADKIRRGEFTKKKMVKGDIAVSPDIRASFEANNVKEQDLVTLTLEDGTTHTGRWMDITADEYAGKPLTGRFDVYTPEGRSPIVGRSVASWSVDGKTKQRNAKEQLQNALEVNHNALLGTRRLSPKKVAEIQREHAIAQVQTKTLNGDFADARNLTEMLKDTTVGGQPLWGSSKAQLQFAQMQEAIDRAEDQEASLNTKASRDKVAEGVAESSLRLLAGPEEGLEDFVKDDIAKIQDDPKYTPAERVLYIEELNKQYADRLARDLNRVAGTDKVVNKALEDFGGKYVETNYAITSADTMRALVVNNPELEQFALIDDPMVLGKKMLNPAFTILTNDVKATVGSRMSLENRDRISKISSGESFTYNVNGKTVDFTGTKNPEEQRNLQLKLVELYQEDLNTTLANELKSRSASMKLTDPLMGKPLTEREKLIETAVQNNIPREVAEKELLKQETKGDVAMVKSDGTVGSKPWYASSKKWIQSGVNQLTNNKNLTPIQSQGIHKTIKDASNKEVKLLMPRIATDPLGSVKELQEVDTSFRNVGLPWQAVNDGYITYQTTSNTADTAGLEVSGGAEVADNYYAINQYLTRAGSESEYGILPIYIMQNRETPEAKAAIERVAKKYNKTAEALVAGQVSWYEFRNINLSK